MKNIRTLLVVALIAIAGATPLHALELSTNGLGQVLIYPYYTVNSGHDTWFTVSNPHRTGAIVRVRFLEGYRGRPVANVNVFLAPHDTWTAGISRTSSGQGALLLTSDHTCTRPAIPASGLAFSSAGYDGTGSLPADDGPVGEARTREGWIEAIAGAQVRPGTTTDLAMRPSGGSPPDCGAIPVAPTDDLVSPASGQINGSVSIIDVTEGTVFGYTPDAISHFTETVLYRDEDNLLEPSLAQANSGDSAAGGAVAYVVADESDGTPINGPAKYDFAEPIDAVTALFMVDAIYNEYLISPSIAASTDWVVTFPTRRFYTDPVYGFMDPGGSRPGYSLLFGNYFPRVVDREGTVVDLVEHRLANSLNVVAFRADSQGAPSEVFDSNLAVDLSPPASEGTARLRFTRDSIDSTSTLTDESLHTLMGQPVTGFAAWRITNSHAQPGLLANYGNVVHHRTSACATDVWINHMVCLVEPLDN